MTIPHILVVGSLNADLVTRTPVVPAGGETLTASSFSTGSGGKGANQAVAAARSSRTLDNTSPPTAKVSMVGAVGDDLHGKQLLSELSENGIDVSGVEVIQGEVSGVAVIIVEESSGQNRILYVPGTNARVVPQHFETFIANNKPDLLILQLETPLETVLPIIELAKKNGIETLLNPAPAVELPESCLKGLDNLVMNETEAGILAGWGSVSITEDNLRKVFEKFEGLGVRNIIVTLGGDGVAYGHGNGQFTKVPAEKVEAVVDTTAAGDTFVGAYAVEVAKSKSQGLNVDMKSAIEKANKAAARTVERAGAMKSIPWTDEV